ncbi:VOC family protein [Mucilaginibacter sp. OK283]|uniref:VOC family protein n=1 Tax=Mucilaginibacter sp. OK283 TaxID=1881049 RepID=UPI0008AB43A6|nr:VOC family protein [Mucilaginibacter sp. OK283]SEP30202.1 Glyoxalase/Bleomycin resistance protein/Dioxygenase superfamily protein [Mucilaginibacter sp. OK283]
MKTKKFIRSSPHLPVKDLKQTLDYYRETLGFYDEWTEGDKDGGIRRDDMRLLFGEDAGFTAAINNTKHRLPLMWFVDNIDSVYAELQERNVEIADGLKTHPYGLREFAFIDINGYYIRVAEGI